MQLLHDKIVVALADDVQVVEVRQPRPERPREAPQRVEEEAIEGDAGVEAGKVRRRKQTREDGRPDVVELLQVQDHQGEGRDAREGPRDPSMCVAIVVAADEVEKMARDTDRGHDGAPLCLARHPVQPLQVDPAEKAGHVCVGHGCWTR